MSVAFEVTRDDPLLSIPIVYTGAFSSEVLLRFTSYKRIQFTLTGTAILPQREELLKRKQHILS